MQQKWTSMLAWSGALLCGTVLPAKAGIVDYVATAPYCWQNYGTCVPIDLYGKPRGFNFDGNRPFVNTTTGQADIAQLQFNGININGASITNSGSGDAHISQQYDSSIQESVTRVILSNGDALTAGSHRTQLNSYPILPYKQYMLDLEFKLDDHWDFNMSPGNGLIWQLKGSPKTGQYGNPVLGINLYGDTLHMDISYPLSAANATAWPVNVQWGANQYVPVSLPTPKITRGEYHHIKLTFFADDRPNKPINSDQPEGKGFISATLDGAPWFQYTGPTLHPDQAGPHKISWGWYQWSGVPDNMPDRIIYYRKNNLSEWQ